MPNEQEQQRMLQAAIASAKQSARAEHKERRPRPKRPDEPVAVDWYCRKCYAELERDRCPRCVEGRRVVSQFCRSCLRVHKNTIKCVAWRPGS